MFPVQRGGLCNCLHVHIKFLSQHVPDHLVLCAVESQFVPRVHLQFLFLLHGHMLIATHSPEALALMFPEIIPSLTADV